MGFVKDEHTVNSLPFKLKIHVRKLYYSSLSLDPVEFTWRQIPAIKCAGSLMSSTDGYTIC